MKEEITYFSAHVTSGVLASGGYFTIQLLNPVVRTVCFVRYLSYVVTGRNAAGQAINCDGSCLLYQLDTSPLIQALVSADGISLDLGGTYIIASSKQSFVGRAPINLQSDLSFFVDAAPSFRDSVPDALEAYIMLGIEYP